MNQDIRKLTDGAMMAAIVGVMLIINRQTAGLLESILIFTFPLPMVFYGAKYGWKSSWLVFTAIILLSLILGTPQTIFYVVSESMIGIIYGCGIHDHWKMRTLILTTILIAVVADLLSMLIFASFFGYDLAGEVDAYVSAVNQAAATTGGNLFGTTDIRSLIKNMIVISTILTGILEGLATHFLSRLMLKRLRFKTEPMTPIFEYYPPKWTGYLGLAGFVIYALTMYYPLQNEMLQNACQGIGMLGILYLCFYAIIGMTMVFIGLFQSKGLAIFLSILMTLLLSALMAIIGFLYIATNLHQTFMKGGESNET